MDNTPRVSVIIPVYNGELVLRKCLNSIIRQSYLNFEIIVVDNNSTDTTSSIIKEFKRQNINIQLFGLYPSR